MSESTCPACGIGELKKISGDYETRWVDESGSERDLIVRGVTREECSECGEVFLDNDATEKIESARLHAMRRLSPAAIRAFRERLGKTQIEMAALLGLGEKTYSRWESGAYIQNAASDRYLRLAMANEANVAILQQLAQREPDLVDKPWTIAVIRVQTFPALAESEALLDTERRFVEMMTLGKTFLPC
jgi:putative zinc finger/helix-turn-helix YgiT family protein